MDMGGRVALVTGANRGMGRGLCEALGELGATVLMVCRNEQAGTEAEEELRRRGMDVTLYIADISSIDDIEALHEEVAAEFDRLDVLVNCAGVLLRGQDISVEDIPLAALETTMAINFTGPFWMCKKFTPLLRNSDSGRIINFHLRPRPPVGEDIGRLPRLHHHQDGRQRADQGAGGRTGRYGHHRGIGGPGLGAHRDGRPPCAYSPGGRRRDAAVARHG